MYDDRAVGRGSSRFRSRGNRYYHQYKSYNIVLLRYNDSCLFFARDDDDDEGWTHGRGKKKSRDNVRSIKYNILYSRVYVIRTRTRIKYYTHCCTVTSPVFARPFSLIGFRSGAGAGEN